MAIPRRFVLWMHSALIIIIIIIIITSTPVIRTGVYPHMPIANRREIQIVYNTGRYRASSGLFLTPDTIHGCPASLSHDVQHIIDFHFLASGANHWVKVHQKGRWPGSLQDVPSYKISSPYINPCPRYKLPKILRTNNVKKMKKEHEKKWKKNTQ